MAPMRRRLILALVAVAMSCVSVISASDERWPRFRGPGARGVSLDSGLPEAWSTTDNVAWVADIDGLGWSSPIVWDDTVFLTTVVSAGDVEAPRSGLYLGGERRTPEDEHRWIVYGIDVATGAVRWEREVHRGVPSTSHHLKNTYASETPVTDGEHVYAYFGGCRRRAARDPCRRQTTRRHDADTGARRGTGGRVSLWRGRAPQTPQTLHQSRRRPDPVNTIRRYEWPISQAIRSM